MLTLWPPVARGTEHVDAQVVLVDLDVGVAVAGIGVDEHTRRRGVDASLRLGDRHALHPVHAALVLQCGPHAVGIGAARAQHHRHVLDAAEVARHRVEHLDLPPAPLGVARVHAGEIACEQRRLLAALPRLDLHDDVVAVVRVARNEQLSQPGLQVGERGRRARRPLRRTSGPRWRARGRRRGRSGPTAARAQRRRPGRARRSAAPACGPGAASACTEGSASARSSSAYSMSSASTVGAAISPPLPTMPLPPSSIGRPSGTHRRSETTGLSGHDDGAHRNDGRRLSSYFLPGLRLP